jgi:hypothetical protein
MISLAEEGTVCAVAVTEQIRMNAMARDDNFILYLNLNQVRIFIYYCQYILYNALLFAGKTKSLQ